MTAPATYLPEEIESLLQELSETHDTWAAGAALFGPGGLWDATRKARLAITSVEIRDGYAEKKEKVTEARLEELAHAHPEYVQWLSESTTERALWLALDAKRTELQMRVKVLTYNPLSR